MVGAPARLTAPGAVGLAGPEAFPFEGQWNPIGPTVDGTAGMYSTQLRTGLGPPAVVAWIDPGAFIATIHPGIAEPGGKWPVAPTVLAEDQPRLAAVFNGGFKFDVARGGLYIDGKTQPELRQGAASLAVLRNGALTVGQWGRDVSLADNPVAVRQNLELLVDGGQPVPGLKPDDTEHWGSTLGGRKLVARSGVGVRSDGSIVYVGAPLLNVTTLASLLAQAGATRAMELDINPSWVTFNWFTWDAAAARLDAHQLASFMHGPATRFTKPDERDFVSISTR